MEDPGAPRTRMACWSCSPPPCSGRAQWSGRGAAGSPPPGASKESKGRLAKGEAALPCSAGPVRGPEGFPLHEPLGGHRPGDLDEAGDVRAVDEVAGGAELLGRLGAVEVDVLHDLL